MTTGFGPVLFVTHQASRTGAPMVLLNLLRWLRSNTATDFEVLALRGGPLEPDFAEIAPVNVICPAQAPRPLDTIERGLSRTRRWRTTDALRRQRYERQLHGRRFPVVYLNSAPTWRVARALPRHQPRVVIGHAHELESGLQAAYPRDEPWQSAAASMDLIVAVADSVATNLVDRHGIPADRIHRHNAFVDVSRIRSSPARVREVRARLGLPPDARVIGAAGTIEWRKGPDLFIALARYLIGRRPLDPLHFLWIGGAGPDQALTQQLRRTGLSARVHFVPAVSDPFPWFDLCDVFTLTSREDPCPLVCLEAAWLGTPVVCFDDAGGMPQFVGSTEDCGVTVPHLDVAAMGDAVLRLLYDRALVADMAVRAARRIKSAYEVAVVAPRLFEDVQRAVRAAAG